MADTPTPKKPAAKRARKAPTKTTAKKAVAPPLDSPVEREFTQTERDQIIAEHTAATAAVFVPPREERTEPIVRYVRNLSGAPFRMKLNRHTPGQRGIQLEPRGNRGDMAPLEQVDLSDPILTDNMNLGLIEIITEVEAVDSMSKQTINQQTSHPALAALRNSEGEGGLTLSVDAKPDEHSIVVAQLEDGQIAFERQPGKAAEIKRPTRQPGEAPGVPANIPGSEPGNHPANEESSFLSDLRSKTSVTPPQGS